MPTRKDFSVLIHPGLNGSGPDHWHTHWEQAFPEFTRVQQADWDHPVYEAWATTLTDYVNRAPCAKGTGVDLISFGPAPNSINTQPQYALKKQGV